jgi:hypothetical protein
MQLVNTIGFREGWLRRLITYCCRELEYPRDRLRKATFSLCHSGDFKGKAYHDRRLIIVRMNAFLEYPLRLKATKLFPSFELADAIELVEFLTAHELAHLAFPDRPESHIEGIGRNITLQFRRHRDQLLPRWGDPGPGPGPTHHKGTIHRWACRRCGRVSRSSRQGRDPHRRACGCCYKAWQVAAAAGEFMVYLVEQAGAAGDVTTQLNRRQPVTPG